MKTPIRYIAAGAGSVCIIFTLYNMLTPGNNVKKKEDVVQQDLEDDAQAPPQFQILRYHPGHNPQKGVQGDRITFEYNQRIQSFYDPPLSQKDYDAAQRKKPRVIMAASSSKLNDALVTISSVQKHMPQMEITIYALGLSEEQLGKLSNLCKVEVKVMSFRQFPLHVTHLYNFAWKSLVVQAALCEYGRILWLDASHIVTVGTGKLAHAWKMARSSGIVFLGGETTKHSTTELTHPKLFKFLPTDAKKMQHSPQIISAPMLLVNSLDLQRHVMRWWIACSLDDQCISPDGATMAMCPESNLVIPKRNGAAKEDESKKHCHQFEHSILNILVKNHDNFDPSTYTTPGSFTLSLKDSVVQGYKLKLCT